MSYLIIGKIDGKKVSLKTGSYEFALGMFNVNKLSHLWSYLSNGKRKLLLKRSKAVEA